jgi:hypothetical protein
MLTPAAIKKHFFEVTQGFVMDGAGHHRRQNTVIDAPSFAQL